MGQRWSMKQRPPQGPSGFIPKQAPIQDARLPPPLPQQPKPSTPLEDPRAEHRLFLLNQDKFHIERRPLPESPLRDKTPNTLLSIVQHRQESEKLSSSTATAGWISQDMPSSKNQSPSLSIDALKSLFHEKRHGVFLHEKSTLEDWEKLGKPYSLSKNQLETLFKFVNTPVISAETRQEDGSSMILDGIWRDTDKI